MCDVHNLKHPVIAVGVCWHAVMKSMDGTLQYQKQSRDAPTGATIQIPLLTLSCLPFFLPNPQC